MDKTFGYENFRNDISWTRSLPHNDPKQYGRSRDTILFYGKAAGPKFNPQHRPQKEESVEAHYRDDGNGRMYRLASLLAPGGRGPRYEFKGIERNWRFTPAKMADLEQRGLVYHEPGQMPSRILYLDESLGALTQDHWEDISPLNPQATERIGYPTQKPAGLLRRIISASSDAGDVVADFFCGGGVTPAVAQELGRRWIACDSSRVAVSVTLNRLVVAGETQSGVTSNYGRAGQVQAKMDLPTPETAVADIRVHYVGMYPMDRFKAVEQAEFEKFILACLAAHADNSDRAITGWRSAREPLRVGPADPDAAPDAKDLQAFFQAVLTRLQPNVRTLARYVCWRTSPELVAYRKRLSEYIRKNVQPRGADLDIDFLLIDSEEFRERIRAKYPDADENEFLLRFTKEPVVGEIAATRTGAKTYRFEARDADSTNAGGYLVNCQWDFDFERGHFAADSKHVLGRTELKGKDAKAKGRKYEAVLTGEHTFDKAGQRTIACRVQDNLGAETVRTLTIEVT